ncbi:MAG: hypothetical protein ACUVTH_01835 [Thermogutta sp.]
MIQRIHFGAGIQVLVLLCLLGLGRPLLAAQPEDKGEGSWVMAESSPQSAEQWPAGAWDRIASQGQPVPVEGTAACCEICGAGYDCPRLWTWYNGAKILGRGRARPKSVSLDRTGAELLNVNNLGFDVAGGYETRVQYYLGNDLENRDQFFEFVYWGLNEWKDELSVRGQRLTYDPGGNSFTAGNLFTFYNFTDFNYADLHRIRYESEINNFELNWWFKPRPRPDRLALLPNGKWQRQCQPGTYFNYAFGLRGLSFDEGFIFASSGSIVSAGGTDALEGRQTIIAKNDTFGFQLVGELLFRRHRFEWGARVKAAPMFNWAEQTTDITLAHSPGHVVRYAKDDDVCFMGEVTILASYRILPRMRAFASYDMMWLDGVALAPEQLDFSLQSPGVINDNGTVFFQGVSLGFDVVW